MNPLDRFAARDSAVHRLDGRIKVVLTLLFTLSTIILPDGAWVGFVLTFLLTVGISVVAQLGPSFAVRRSFVALPFALAAITVLFTTPGPPVFSLPWPPLTISSGGLIRYLSIVARTWLAVQFAVLLTATTPIPELLIALRALRVPGPLVEIVALMIRYLTVLVDEAARLLRARSARSAALADLRSGGALAWRAGVAGTMAGQLFLRSYERGERVTLAMAARGYGGTPRLLDAPSIQADAWGMTLIALAMIIATQLMARVVL
ncbi:MAG: cobalt ECF transporter T component CbiQ [Dehalococcoidia bacterium]